MTVTLAIIMLIIGALLASICALCAYTLHRAREAIAHIDARTTEFHAQYNTEKFQAEIDKLKLDISTIAFRGR